MSLELRIVRPGLLLLALVGQVSCGPSGGSVGPARGAVAGACGNGVLDPGEQCDDGNTANLDGCDSTCHFEQVQRANSLTVLFSSDSFCTANALGGAIRSPAQSSVQGNVARAITDGSLSVMMQFVGLADLTGGGAQSFTLSTMQGSPVDPDAGYNGNSDLDWWYTASLEDVGPNNVQLQALPGAISNGLITAGPGRVTMPFGIGSGVTRVNLSDVKALASVGAATAPTLAQANVPPGHRPTEHVDPSLRTFASSTGGELCGNISAASLALIPVPDALTSGATACSEGYTTQNSMLDVLVGGCNVFILTAIAATQPDAADSSIADAGAPPYRLRTSPSRAVNGCTDSTGASIPLDTCLAAAAYSSAMRFTSDRVIITGVK